MLYKLLLILVRPDFIGGIDNEALDFGQLDSFIHTSPGAAAATDAIISNSVSPSLQRATTTSIAPIATSLLQLRPSHSQQQSKQTLAAINSRSTVTTSTAMSLKDDHLPESPPDSGSEPAYSPHHHLTSTTKRNDSEYTLLTGGDFHHNNEDFLKVDPDSGRLSNDTTADLPDIAPSLTDHHLEIAPVSYERNP